MLSVYNPKIRTAFIFKRYLIFAQVFYAHICTHLYTLKYHFCVFKGKNSNLMFIVNFITYASII